jgi:TonB family protein
MNSFANYAIEVNLGFVFFYGVYYLLISNETDFKRQRMFLLSGLLCSLVFPLIHIEWNSSPVLVQSVSDAVIILPTLLIGSAPTPSIDTVDILWIFYVAVALVIAVPVMSQAVRLYLLFNKKAGTHRDRFYVIESDSDGSSWSFFRLIFIGKADKLSSEDKELVVRHEMLHGRLLHSADIILVTVLCMLCWFNPLIWIYRKTLSRVHEFEVDAIVAGETGKADYGVLLAKTALAGNGLLLTHHFNQSFILKRINMLNMLKRRISGWKLTVLATMVVVYFVAVACTDQEPQKNIAGENSVIDAREIPLNVTDGFAQLKEKHADRTLILTEVGDKEGYYKLPEDVKGLIALYTFPESGRTWIVTEEIGDQEVFTVVEETASPRGGMTAFYEELSNNLIYPEEARRLGIEGKVFIEFVVMEDGHLTDFKVLKGIGAGCDTEALRAVMQMAPWTPGQMRGKAVPQRLVMPITFHLE